MEARQGDGCRSIWRCYVRRDMYMHRTARVLLIIIPHRSAVDEISGQTVAIKLVTRIFDKVQLAKRALREITLLRHFAGHENITGLIDVDAISPDFNEM